MTTEAALTFSSFGLSEVVLSALARKGFTAPSSIQALALPRLLADQGHLVAKARTGTGKTAAFGIPLVERLNSPSDAPKALILTPTRELALQVAQEIRSLSSGPFPRIAAVYGGASIGSQLRDLARGVEIVVGTPGRVMDHLDRGSLKLSSVDWFILDEADEMLDMGFFEDVETILGKTKPERRVALFSATMPDAILSVVRRHIGVVDIVEDAAAVDEKPAVDQFFLVLRREDKLEALRRVVDSADSFYGLVFCGTKVETDEVARRLVEGGYAAEAIHGDLSQEARERTLRRFRSKLTTILVATDVAARGIDVERLTHVVNWDLPNDREMYVHRIGRTGRAGRRGTAISFVPPIARGRMVQLSRSMERVLGTPILRMDVPPVESVMAASRRKIMTSILTSSPGYEEVQAKLSSAGGDVDIAGAGSAGIGVAAAAAATGPAAEIDWDEMPESFGSKDPRSVLAGTLIKKLGARRAVEALVSAAFGDELDPSRYSQILEIPDRPMMRNGPSAFHPPMGRGGRVQREEPSPRRIGQPGHYAEGNYSGGHPGSRFAAHKASAHQSAAYQGGPHRGGHINGPRPFARDGARHEGAARLVGAAQDGAARQDGASRQDGAGSRVYVGVGRRHGASAKDVAGLLMRAGGVPGRMVDGIEVRDFCAFATMPPEAARRAYDFARRDPEHPAIKPAVPQNEGPRE